MLGVFDENNINHITISETLLRNINNEEYKNASIKEKVEIIKNGEIEAAVNLGALLSFITTQSQGMSEENAMLNATNAYNIISSFQGMPGENEFLNRLTYNVVKPEVTSEYAGIGKELLSSSMHFFPAPGFSHGAGQKIFGYINGYDIIAQGIGVDGARLDLGDITLRLWKGDYGIFNNGVEFGFYSATKNDPLTKEELDRIGITGTSVELFNKNDNSLITQYTEKGPSFWTHATDIFSNEARGDVYSVNTITFKTAEQAQIYHAMINYSLNSDQTKYYQYDQEKTYDIRLLDNSIQIQYGNPRVK
jgi:hypothetical protein